MNKPEKKTLYEFIVPSFRHKPLDVVKLLITDGLVYVNGKQCLDPNKKVSSLDTVGVRSYE